MRVLWELSNRSGHLIDRGDCPVLEDGNSLTIVFDKEIMAREGDRIIVHYVENPDDRRSLSN